MRLIHLSDIRLDRGYGDLCLPAEFGPARREAVRDAFRRTMEVARNWPADAILISGNLYERDGLSRATRSMLRESFEALGKVPVFIAPGNADTLNALAPSRIDAWPENVHVFESPDWDWHLSEDESVAVLGRAHDASISNGEVPNDIPDAGVRIVCAHAPWSDETRNDLVSHIDYAAWGSGAPSAETPFTFAAHAFGDEPGSYRRVTIADGRADVESVSTDLSPLCDHTFSVGRYDSAEALIVDLNRACEDSNAAHRVTITGDLSAATADAWLGPLKELQSAGPMMHIADETRLTPDAHPQEGGTVMDAVSHTLATQSNDATDSYRQSMLARAQVIALSAMRGDTLSLPGEARP